LDESVVDVLSLKSTASYSQKTVEEVIEELQTSPQGLTTAEVCSHIYSVPSPFIQLK
jgi:hypothetical protein